MEITLSDQWVRVNSKMATVRHTLDAKTSTNGLINTIKLKALLFWGKQKSDWILLAKQTVK
jgi:hypothetical protein